MATNILCYFASIKKFGMHFLKNYNYYLYKIIISVHITKRIRTSNGFVHGYLDNRGFVYVRCDINIIRTVLGQIMIQQYYELIILIIYLVYELRLHCLQIITLI